MLQKHRFLPEEPAELVVRMGFHIPTVAGVGAQVEEVIEAGERWRHAEAQGDGAEGMSLGEGSHSLVVAL